MTPNRTKGIVGQLTKLRDAEDPTMARLGAQGAEARLELVNKDRQEKVIRP